MGTRDPSKKEAVGNFWEKEAPGTRGSLGKRVYRKPVEREAVESFLKKEAGFNRGLVYKRVRRNPSKKWPGKSLSQETERTL